MDSSDQSQPMSRLPGLAYDAAILAMAVWFLLSGGSWLAWSLFVLLNVMALGIFHNKLLPRSRYLVRPWDAAVILVFQSALLLLPTMIELSESERIGALVGVAVFVGVRALMTGAPKMRQPRSRSRQPDPG